MTPEEVRPTGGQINVAGILYQLLVSLAEGLETTVTEGSLGPDQSTVVLHIEPFDGGDVQVTGRRRLIVQIKVRARDRHWTTGALIRDVLPDLFNAVRVGTNDRFQFVTDNDAGCDDFRRFLEWIRSNAANGRASWRPAAQKFRLGQGGGRKTGEEVLRVIAEALPVDGVDDPRLIPFLASLEIIRRDRHDLIGTINRHLRVLVEAVEDVRHKRKQLVGELIELGSTGAEITTSELLERAGLDTRRFVHANQLPTRLRQELARSFETLKYEPTKDVRPPLPAPARPVTVLRGESGLGKTWRLCATAQAMSEAGKAVILLRASTNLEALRSMIATTIWNPTYTNEAPFRSIADRLRPKLADGRGTWLTVFLDDLNDPELARRIVEDRWMDLGIDLVVSSQPRTADWLRAESAAEVQDVPEFTPRELIAYLEALDVHYTEVPNDVFALLRTPILAKLYCLLPRGLIFEAETEYQLMHRFWEHAANDRASHVSHPFDLDRLEQMVGGMLGRPSNYPWPPAAVLGALGEAATARLIESGVVELDGDRRLSMTHDRLLNWAMAKHLATSARDRNLDASQLLELVRQATNVTTVSGVRMGGRLGYVLMDLLWLLLGSGERSPTQVASFLFAYLRDPEFDAADRENFRHQLPTLGKRAVPLLRTMVEQGFDRDREALWPNWIAEAMRKLADVAWPEIRDAAVVLFRSGIDDRIEVALRVLAKTGSDELVSDLFDLTVTRTVARDAATGRERIDHIRAQTRAFDAFARSVSLTPWWLDAQIAATTLGAEAEQLLWALLQLSRSIALPIWRAHRDRFFQIIPEEARVLPRAVRVFADPDDLPRLKRPSPTDAEAFHVASTFDAIARINPAMASQILKDDTNNEIEVELIGTEGWWMPGLHHRIGDELGRALTEQARRIDPARPGTRLALHYGGQPELINVETVDLLLDELEAVITEAGGSDAERLRQSYRIMETLSSMRTVPTLDRIASRRGTRLEDGLVALGIGRPLNESRAADRELEMIAWLLAMMAGEGFDSLVLGELSSPGVTTRDYGYRHALWTTATAVGDALEQQVDDWDGVDQDRPYPLAQALAAHGRERGLMRLIEGASPVYTNAVDIWQARGGDTAALVEAIRAKVASENDVQQVQAVDLSHFVEVGEALALTMPLVTSGSPGDAVAKRLLMLHFHREQYEPALLPKLRPFLESEDATGPTAALHLALHGDAEGRGAAIAWLREHDLALTQGRGIEVAGVLLDHEDSKDAAIDFLKAIRERNQRASRLDATILDKLAQHGDVAAQQQLMTLAFGSGRDDLAVVAGAVRVIARADAHGAFQAAQRLFVQSGQLGAAQILMEVDPRRGVRELMGAYVGAPPSTRIAIARTLRRLADPNDLLPALEAMASDVMENVRVMAAEVAGWLPHGEPIRWIDMLISDQVLEVEQAALAAARRRAAGAAAEEILDRPGPAEAGSVGLYACADQPRRSALPGEPRRCARYPPGYRSSACGVPDRGEAVDREKDPGPGP